jgi:hypothetical protein
MRCSKGLDTFGKQRLGTDAQTVASPDLQAIGCCLFCLEENEGHNLKVVQCGSQENSDLNIYYVDENNHRFSVNQCESHGRSELHTISLIYQFTGL